MDIYLETTGLYVFTGNRLEILAEYLARIVNTPLSSPFVPETIVVQSNGMERWISMELARLNGICGNCQYPFPNAFLDQIFKKLIPDLPELSPFVPSVLTFRIMNLLSECIEQPEF